MSGATADKLTPQAGPSGRPRRKETFIARYPRKLKLSLLAVLLIAAILPVMMGKQGPESEAAKQTTAAQATHAVHGKEKQAVIPNPDLEAQPPNAAGAAVSQIINPQDDRSVKLVQAPEPDVTEDTAEGSLPKIGASGHQPWQVYARPFNAGDTRPRVAIIVTGLGQSRLDTDTAIARLPANVTLAFDSQSPVVGAWLTRARQDGHETLMMVPMEPFDYPHSDPGPNTLLTSLPNTDNMLRLLAALRQGSGYVGITTITGSRFTTNPEKLDPVLELLKERGLMIVDARVAPHSAVSDMAHERQVPVAVTTEQLDANLAPAAIDASLNQLEQSARLTGHAVGYTAAFPIMLDRLQVWLRNLPDQGIALAPISALVK